MKLKKLFENSFYSDDTEKADFLSHDKKVISSFWINILGSVGCYILYADTVPYVKLYFKSELKLKLDNIVDDNNDPSIIVKIVSKDLKDTTVRELTRFLARLKKGLDVDEYLFKTKLFEKLYRELKHRKPLPKCDKIIKGYNDGSLSLLDCVILFKQLAVQQQLCGEFRVLNRKCKIPKTLDPNGSSPVVTPAQVTAPTPVKRGRGRPPKNNASPVVTPTQTTPAAPPTPTVEPWENHIENLKNGIYDDHSKRILDTYIKFVKGEDISNDIGKGFGLSINIDDFRHVNRSILKNNFKINPKVSFNENFLTLVLYFHPTRINELLVPSTQYAISNILNGEDNIITMRMLSSLDVSLDSIIIYNIMSLILTYKTHGSDKEYFFEWIVSNLHKLSKDNFERFFFRIDPSNDPSIDKEIVSLIKGNMNDDLKARLEKTKYAPVYLIGENTLNLIVLDIMFQMFTRGGVDISSGIKKFKGSDVTFKDLTDQNIIDFISKAQFPKHIITEYFSDDEYNRIMFTNKPISFFAPMVDKDTLKKMFKPILKDVGTKSNLVFDYMMTFSEEYSDEEFSKIIFENFLDRYFGSVHRATNFEEYGVNFSKADKVFQKLLDHFLQNNQFSLGTKDSSFIFSSERNFSFDNLSKQLDFVFGDTYSEKLFKKHKESILDKVNEKDIIKYFIEYLTVKDLQEYVFEIYDGHIPDFALALNDGFNLTVDPIKYSGAKVPKSINTILNLISSDNMMMDKSSSMGFVLRRCTKFLNNDELDTKALKGALNKMFKNNPIKFLYVLDIQYSSFDGDSIAQRNKDIFNFIDFNSKEIQDALSDLSFVEDIGQHFVNHSNALDILNKSKNGEWKRAAFSKYVENYTQHVNKSLKRGGILPDIRDFIFDLMQENPKNVDDYLEILPDNIKSVLFKDLRKFASIEPLLSSIHTSPVVPQKKLNAEDINNALKYNNFDVDEIVKVRKKRGENFSDTIERTREIAKKETNKVPEQKVNKINRSEKEFAEITYQMNKMYHAGKHGDIGAQIIEEFDVSLKMGEWEGFRKEWKDEGDGILKPAFHGTNGTAAAMILRFGFAVLSAKELQQAGGKYAGSMLGAGVYSAPNLDKISNYIGDSNYGQFGSVGYVFMMDQTLGQRNVHYRAAGIGNDGIRSPEYCSKYPREQIKIVKCFKAIKSSLKYISNKAKEHGVVLDEAFENQIWGEVIMENTSEDVNQGFTTFIFMEDLIPINKDEALSLEQIEFDNDILVGQCQDGIEINIPNNSGTFRMFKVADTFEALTRKHDSIIKFLSAIDGKINLIKQ